MDKRLQYILNTKRPGHNIVYHPRAFSKPIHCRAGIHTFNGIIDINGVKSLYCSKCGSTIGKGIYEKTVTKQDLQKEHDARARNPRTNKQMLNESWRKLEELRKRNSDESIRRYVNRKLVEGGKI